MKVPSIASLVVSLVALGGITILAQARGGTPQTDKVQPVNSGANPYRVIRDWGKIEGREWGGSNGVAIDKDGKSVWAVDRCSPGTTPGCANTNANPVHHFGARLRQPSFGAIAANGLTGRRRCSLAADACQRRLRDDEPGTDDEEAERHPGEFRLPSPHRVSS